MHASGRVDRVAAVCGLCSADCGLEIQVRGGSIEAVRGQKSHRFSAGYVCAKGRALGDIQSAPDRLRTPLLRSGGNLREASWDEALAFVGTRLLEVRQEHGPESVAFHVGRAGIGKEFFGHVRLLSRVLGSPNFSCAGSHCHFGMEMGNTLTYGGLGAPDFGRSKCLVFWGYNPSQSAPALARRISPAREAGARMIVIDPSDTALARRADLHLKPRPGTDAPLALAMLHVVVRDALYDAAFVRDWTVGFEELVAHLEAYSPRAVQALTGVPASLIEAAARMYAEAPSAAVGQGNALELHLDGVQAARAVACLIALCGNIDIAGGNLLKPRRGLAALGRVSGGGGSAPPVGAREFPVFHRSYREAQANLYWRSVLGVDEGEEQARLRGMVVVGSNPLVQWPGSSGLREAFARLELLVVSDLFMTETARQADVVLPATLPVERDELWDAMSMWAEPRFGLAPRVAAPPAGARTDVEMVAELAHRMGFGEHFAWVDDAGALDRRLAPLGLTRDALAELPEGVVYAELRERSYVDSGFATPSGKVELWSSVLEANGHAALPTPAASRIGTSSSDDGRRDARRGGGGTGDDYPITLTSGARTVGYVHGRYRTVESLRRLVPEPLLELGPETAGRLGIADGDLVEISSPHGRVRVKTRLAGDLLPGVARMPHGWEATNVNLLSSARIEDLDPVSGFPAFRSLPVAVRRIEENEALIGATPARPGLQRPTDS